MEISMIALPGFSRRLAVLLVAVTLFAVSSVGPAARPAYAASKCGEGDGPQCSTNTFCILLPLSATSICFTKYFYYELHNPK
jgi:hypothetical protein